MKQAVGDPDEDEVGAGEKEDKLIEEDGLAGAVPDQLEDEYQRDCPFKDQYGNEGDRLIVDDVFHGPVKQWWTNHAQGGQTQIHRDKDDYLDVGE